MTVQSQPFEPQHQPVLCREILSLLKASDESSPSKSVAVFVDGTLGEGGHSAALLEATAPTGRVIGFDKDPEAIRRVKSRFASTPYQERLILMNQSYSQAFSLVPELLAQISRSQNNRPAKVRGLVLDLGLSSRQLEEAERGFSFQKEGPLDMRFNQEESQTARDIVNRWPEGRLITLLEDHEESWAKRIVAQIMTARRQRPIETTTELAILIRSAIPKKFWSHRLDPATKTFQALRIATNNELDCLKTFLKDLPGFMQQCFEPGGRTAIISFHSLEDRLVKQAFRSQKQEGPFEVLTKRPLVGSSEEIRENPRARSAKLRVLEYQGGLA